MGTFLDSLCVKRAEPGRIAAILREQFPAQRAFVALQGRHWASVFLDWRGQMSGGPDLVSIGRTVCSGCGCPGIAFRVVDSDFLYWWVFSEAGEVITQSCREEAYDSPSDDEQIGLGGDLDALAQLMAEGGLTAEGVRQVIELGMPGSLQETVSLLLRLLKVQYGETSYDDLIAAVQRDQTFGYDWTKDWAYVGSGSPLSQTGTPLGDQLNEVQLHEMLNSSSGRTIQGIGPFIDRATGQATMIVISKADQNVTLSLWKNPGGVTTIPLDPASILKLVDALKSGNKGPSRDD